MIKSTASLLFLLVLSACASAPEKQAGFTCTHVVLVESVIAGNKVIQERCTRWERKAREKETIQEQFMFYKNKA